MSLPPTKGRSGVRPDRRRSAPPGRGRKEAQLAAALGRLGAWLPWATAASATRVRSAVAHVEDLGYRSLWLPEGGKDVFVNASIVLAATSHLLVVSSVAGIWGRSPYVTATAARTLGDAYPGRFVLGIGVGHEESDSWFRAYERPLAQMRDYLEAMDEAVYGGPIPTWPVQRLLGALGPRMLALARDRTRGANPYFVPVEHTKFARDVLGPEPVLAVEQAVVVGPSASRARELARRHLSRYLRTRNYTENLRRFGFRDRDFVDGGSTRLTEALVAWGTPERIAERIRRHWDAGADHVCIQPLHRDERPPLSQLAKIAAVLRPELDR